MNTVETKVFERVHILTPTASVLFCKFFFLCVYMATLTMQYHKRTERWDTKLPLKDKPFGFKKSLALGMLSAFCYFILMYMLVPPIHFDIFQAPQIFHLSSCNDTLSTDKLQLSFYSIISKSKLWCTLVVSMQNTQSYTDNHIKEMAWVDGLPKMTELLYHSPRASKGLDYWWIDCDCMCAYLPNGHGMPAGVLHFVCICMQNNVIICIHCGWWTATSLLSRPTSCSTHQSRWPHNSLIPWWWTTVNITGYTKGSATIDLL